MPTKPGSRPKNEFVFFDVVYEDGSQRSNRRVPAELLGGLEKDEPARGFIIEQDREIAEKSGRTPPAIKSIMRVGAKPEAGENVRFRRQRFVMRSLRAVVSSVRARRVAGRSGSPRR